MHKILITGGSGFIGKNFIRELNKTNYSILNIDIVKPNYSDQDKYWRECDILNKTELTRIIINFQPHYVLHLAAKTDTYSNEIYDYSVNTLGTKNVIEICNNIPDLKRIVITSTQYVYKNNSVDFPANDDDYNPHTVYGESKKQSEIITKKYCLKNWIIIRPTNIWGPFNLNYRNGLFKYMKMNLFFLPAGNLAKKSYGYVGNICYQISQIMHCENIRNEILYVGEENIDSRIWLESIHKELTNKRIFYIPRIIFLIFVKLGDIFSKLKLPFPLNTMRYKNMTENYMAPTNKTLNKFGLKYTDMSKNIKTTVDWINS